MRSMPMPTSWIVQVQLDAPAIEEGIDLTTLCGRFMEIEIDADGEWPNDGDFAAARDLGALLIDLGLQSAIDRVQEVLAVITNMKPK